MSDTNEQRDPVKEAPPNKSAVRAKHLKQIADEIRSLRGWLDYLERDLEHDKGVIHAVLLTSISESSMKIVYNAGIANGAVLSKDED